MAMNIIVRLAGVPRNEVALGDYQVARALDVGAHVNEAHMGGLLLRAYRVGIDQDDRAHRSRSRL